MNDYDIERKIVALYEGRAEFPLTRMDIGITLMKMSDSQKSDLVAMMDYFRNEGQEVGYIAAQVGHDLSGFMEDFLTHGGPSGFSPRSHGFAAKDTAFDVKRDILGMIHAQNPCGVAQLRGECLMQSIGFEKLSTYDQDCLMEKVINDLLESKQIAITLCGNPKSTGEPTEVVFDFPR